MSPKASWRFKQIISAPVRREPRSSQIQDSGAAAQGQDKAPSPVSKSQTRKPFTGHF